jgi:nucleoside-diphosphate-sugar epimerase
MKRVLVTGGTGFIGRHTLPDLVARGFDVHVAGRSKPAPDFPPDATFHDCDLLDAGAASLLTRRVAPTHLLHLGWYAKPGLFWTSLENLRWVAASLNLYLAFAEAGGARAVMAGTCAEYDWSFTELDEVATPLAPRTLYGQSKHALQTLLAHAALGTSVRMCWGRVFFLYGPHEAPGRLVSDVIQALLERREAHCSDGTQQRDFMHVADAGRAFAALLDSDIAGPVNVASGVCVPVRTIISTLGSLTQASDLIRFGAVSRSDEPPRLAASTDILHGQLGFRPLYDLHSGLAHTVDWWRIIKRRGQSNSLEASP